jgi:hypothetical protein
MGERANKSSPVLMHKIIITTSLTLILSLSSYGQWYVKKYNVSDISLLTKEQLDESLKESRTNLIYSGAASVTGVAVFLAGRYLPYEMDEESTFFEQLIGERGMKGILMVTGVGITVGGAVAAVVYLGRIGKIKSIINEYYSYGGKLNFSPVVIVNNSTKSIVPGFTLTYNF